MPRRNGTGIELLADPTRRRIVALLAQHPARSSQIAAAIGLSRPATSRQLGLLVNAQLVTFSWFAPDRRGVLYALEPNAAGPILAWLAAVEIRRPRPPWPRWWRRARVTTRRSGPPDPSDRSASLERSQKGHAAGDAGGPGDKDRRADGA